MAYFFLMSWDSIRPKSIDKKKPPPFLSKYTKDLLTVKLRNNCHYRNHSRDRDTVSKGKWVTARFSKALHKLNFGDSEGFLKIVLNPLRDGRSKTLALF